MIILEYYFIQTWTNAAKSFTAVRFGVRTLSVDFVAHVHAAISCLPTDNIAKVYVGLSSGRK